MSNAPPQPETTQGLASASSSASRIYGAAIGTTALVSALSYLTPPEYSATLVSLGFFGCTYALVLRRSSAEISESGLAMGGLFGDAPLQWKRLLQESGRALTVALALSVLIFPAFFFAWQLWWTPERDFHWTWGPAPAEALLGQLLVVAVPEEMFYRGYLHGALDKLHPPRWRIFGAQIGPSLLIASAIFALGHVITEPHPNRLAVFFPALLFGWMRARTGGIGAAVIFHAFCNLFATSIERGYGLIP
ncbi:MAG: CPBP family intramembrane metalloprotease [Polyangiaceae bacterium]|nr:CPBP family intramembrane metalloprotease [Polyangiaceae bacterium]